MFHDVLDFGRIVPQKETRNVSSDADSSPKETRNVSSDVSRRTRDASSDVNQKQTWNVSADNPAEKKVSTSLGHTARASKSAKVAWINSGFAKFALAQVLGLAVHSSAARVVSVKRCGSSAAFANQRRCIA